MGDYIPYYERKDVCVQTTNQSIAAVKKEIKEIKQKWENIKVQNASINQEIKDATDKMINECNRLIRFLEGNNYEEV